MELAYVLIHSPSVGPLTWAPVAQRLTGSGRVALVPDLTDVTDSTPPFWPRISDRVSELVTQLPAGQPVMLVVHSNAGLFVPPIVAAAPRPIEGCIFVDAALPARTGPTPAAPPELLEFLRSKVTEGRLPPWTTWWDEADVAPMFPDASTRASVSAEQPCLPISYYEQLVPGFDGWDARPCGYLLFGPPYDETAQTARDRGWLVDHIPGHHIHQIVDADAVTDRLVAMAERMTTLSSAAEPGFTP
jgi:hypothetical protein